MPYHYTTESDVVYIYLIINFNESQIFLTLVLKRMNFDTSLPMFIIYRASFGTISIGIREITLAAWEDKITINHQ